MRIDGGRAGGAATGGGRAIMGGWGVCIGVGVTRFPE